MTLRRKTHSLRGPRIHGRRSKHVVSNTVTIDSDYTAAITRFSLNFKKLPYKTINLEYPDIQAEFVKAGIPASSKWADGRPLYSSPSIFDSSTNKGVTDSYQIAQYLDKAYPDTPKLFPPGTEALQAAFYTQFNDLINPFFPLLLPKVPQLLNPPGEEYFNRTRTAIFGKPLTEVDPKGVERVEAWKKVEAVYDTLNGWLSKSTGPYFMGDTVTFADVTVAGMIYATEAVFGKDSQEFKDLMTWNNGRWAAFRKSMEQYAT
jgi:glutathione S-transferase